MNLAEATNHAKKLADRLRPHCERIEIAGSIRRRRETCNDIDLVIIPKLATETVKADLFSEKEIPVNQTFQFLLRSVGSSLTWRGPTPSEKVLPENLMLKTHLYDFDIFFCDAQTWGSVLLCRTGSKNHNIRFCNRAKMRGLHWTPNKGIYDRKKGEFLPAGMETDLYAALELPYYQPRDRDNAKF